MKRFDRLFSPKRLAIIGGGTWCEAIVGAARQLGFSGEIVPVHPTRSQIASIPCAPSLGHLTKPPDAAFVGVNRAATVGIVAELAAMGAGGAVCFASGFAEAEAETMGARDLQDALLTAAGDMPILGPNCYGFLNALDGAGLWPDQHGLRRVERGVAILTQSSNIAINLTMQMRGLPVAMVVTCGNQAQTSQAEIALALLDDPRVTAIGLHIEGFGDLRAWEQLASMARERGVPLIALKSGRSEQAQAAAISHTASLTGADAGADAFMRRLGIGRVHSLPALLEALKIAHLFGHLPSARIASISCSGGEAALAADTAHGHEVSFPPLTAEQTRGLREALGPKVALANPLDYHTYIWRDGPAMALAWGAMADAEIALTVIILDYPRGDICDTADWDIATEAVIEAARSTGARFAVCATLPELMPEATARALMAAGVLPLSGIDTAMEAIAAMVARPVEEAALLLPGTDKPTKTLTEAEAKAALAAFGLAVPRGVASDRANASRAAQNLKGPLAIKVLGLDHKTGAQGLALNVDPGQINAALKTLAQGPLWIEEMVSGALVELLVGVVRDPAHGFLLTLAAGGTMTELLDDQASLLIPASREAIFEALKSLRMAPLFHGYRGSAPVDMEAALDAIEAIQSYVAAHAATMEEVEVNPLILTADAAIAADALIRKADHEPD